MIVKKTFKKYSKIQSESFYKRRRWFWFTHSMLTLTNPFLEAGPFPLWVSALDSSPEPRNANGGKGQRERERELTLEPVFPMFPCLS